MREVSDWLKEHYCTLPSGGSVLDLACGGGRHSLFLQDKGYQVTATDIDVTSVQAANLPSVTIKQADLEKHNWPFGAEEFDGIVVVNYLWRAHFPKLKKTLKPGGVLVFDTFMMGNEVYGRPSNPEFLLKPDELKEVFADMEILAFQQGYSETPSPSMRQSIVVRKPVL